MLPLRHAFPTELRLPAVKLEGMFPVLFFLANVRPVWRDIKGEQMFIYACIKVSNI